jgi:hypothetical protein
MSKHTKSPRKTVAQRRRRENKERGTSATNRGPRQKAHMDYMASLPRSVETPYDPTVTTFTNVV